MSSSSPRGKTRPTTTTAASSSSPARRTKSTTVKSAKESATAKEPKLIQKPKPTAQAAPKPVVRPVSNTATTDERGSPNPPPPERFDGKRYKFTDGEMAWAWDKLTRMAQKDQFFTLAKACEALAQKVNYDDISWVVTHTDTTDPSSLGLIMAWAA